ncbi:hypothetical protein HOP50_03g27220 [Chloropicon primus]|uniref:ABM domain-containing protein n=1 Tax=Chloropicon primus TaxID=1764295 RepID=A0A5B8MJE4_9CHLO|nr:hypothetical protein A3770_03p27220 [Chloropicon primus]UPQ99414.1 hypothetical protein HOP50_03g27220 [Chloropicon primus]|mmetsp:Transcript_4180/g.12186  ORF Transcript_4180/g.12186 Transcript_4180/m.12186 type:complete len:142 (-) Transcript_4180:223-648(-)|eukprot:QDZ20204.1 hypothetical protein A3770_03p27220 [Chloropicon primus]
MLPTTLRAARKSLSLRGAVAHRAQQRQSVRAYAEIPVNKVCRMVQCKVPDEAAGVEMDKLLDEADKVMKKGVPGYVGATRMICKSYWDFKSVMVFDSVSALEGYMESEVKEKEIMPILEKAKAFAVDEDIKLQNFVYDQLS